MLKNEKKVEEIVPFPSYNKNRNARQKVVVSRVQPVKPQYRKEPFNTDNREVYCMKETKEKIEFDYDLLGPVQNQKKNMPRKYSNKGIDIKNTFQEVEIRREKHKASIIYQNLSNIGGPNRISKVSYCYKKGNSVEKNEKYRAYSKRPKDPRPTNNDSKCYNRNRIEKETRINAKEDKYKKEINRASSELNVKPNYDTIALNVVNSYLEEPKNSNNDNDDETWFPCNEEISEDWLDPNDCEKLITTSVEVELETIEKVDKANNSIQKLSNNNKIGKKIEYSNKAEEVQIGQNNYQPYGISIEQNKHRVSTKVNKTSQTYDKKISYPNRIGSKNNKLKTKRSTLFYLGISLLLLLCMLVVTYWEENKIAYLYKSNIINLVTRSNDNMTFFYQKSTKDGYKKFEYYKKTKLDNKYIVKNQAKGINPYLLSWNKSLLLDPGGKQPKSTPETTYRPY
ncbi:hypothetical protein F8M41_009376 [Gigaspora margarita]|uniref:Uncharacterized protein n=1 Tax=Gigaspora margarita TaxID=4874 RepID=A0A8H4A212_GIGMA|nr:hypothetical protein F8M41_009376 [Gigaspora margarita]